MSRFRLDWANLAEGAWVKGTWILFLAFGIMYAPTYIELAQGPWETDQGSHGPLIVAIAVFIALSKMQSFTEIKPEPAFLLGGAVLFAGLFFYIVGQSQGILIAATGSQLLVLVGLILLLAGWKGLVCLWFPLFFLIFSVPIPGWIMDALTAPLKIYLSELVTSWLFDIGYPVAQNGVIVFIGQYQLLVKDACVGLNSLFSLSSVGLLYIYLSKPAKKIHVAVLLLAILPISFMANAVRVTGLVLITYYLGEEAGQGFLHDFSGIVMFVAALLLFFMIDNLLFGWSGLLKRNTS